MATTTKRPSTSEMQVTSIRLEPELKEKLRELSSESGYQTLIRDILWQYVRQHDPQERSTCLHAHLRCTLPAIAQREERCAITGALISAGQSMFLGLTVAGELLPLSEGISSEVHHYF